MCLSKTLGLNATFFWLRRLISVNMSHIAEHEKTSTESKAWVGGALKKRLAVLYVHSSQAFSWHVCSHSGWDLLGAQLCIHPKNNIPPQKSLCSTEAMGDETNESRLAVLPNCKMTQVTVV